MQPRDYQKYAIDSIFKYFYDGNKGNPIVAMPTATGKSHVIAGFVGKTLESYPNQKILVLSHVKEIIEQNKEKMDNVYPLLDSGIHCSGLKSKDVEQNLIFGTIGSVHNNVNKFGRIDLLLIDECHMVSNKSNTMYRKVIDILKRSNDNLRVIGFTATQYRMGQGLLTEPGNIFTDVCCEMTDMQTFNWFIEKGYLSPLIPRKTGTEYDTSGVKVQGGEFNLKQLQKEVNKDGLTEKIVEESIKECQDRNYWLIFASGVEHTEQVNKILKEKGIKSTCVHSKMDNKERDKRIKDFKNGRYQSIVNNNILTTGFDFPSIDAIIMLRPTRSTALWVQMLGRGTRIAEGKENCLVLDFAHNTTELGPINDPVLPQRRNKKGGKAPVKLCDSCGTYIHASVRVCPNCGKEFPASLKVDLSASAEDLIRKSDEPQVVEMNVDRIEYRKHNKPGKPASLRVDYHCGIRKFSEWVCLEHTGYPKKKATMWWKDFGFEEVPETVEEALERKDELSKPDMIKVWVNRKYPEILDHGFLQ